MLKAYSTVDQVGQGVEEGIDGAVSQWGQQIADAKKNTPRLKELVAQIIRKVQEERPEAKWNFGVG